MSDIQADSPTTASYTQAAREASLCEHGQQFRKVWDQEQRSAGVAAFQFFWPALNSTFIRVSALGVVVGLVFAARKAGVLPIFSLAEAEQLPRGIYFLSSFLGMAVMWIAFSPGFENKISLDNVIVAVLFGLMWAALSS